MDFLRETEASLFLFAVLEKKVDFSPVQSDVWHTKTEGGNSMGHSTASGRTIVEPENRTSPTSVTPSRVKLVRNQRTGDYYTEDMEFQIERGSVGWNINRRDSRGWYRNEGYADTLKEARESLRMMR